ATAAMRGLDAAAPPVAAALRDLGRRVTGPLSEAFIPGAGTTPGVRETLLELSGAQAKAKEGLVQAARRRLGSDRLTPEQATEVFDRLMAGRRAELAARRRAEATRAAFEGTDALRQPEIPGTRLTLPKEPEQLGLGLAEPEYAIGRGDVPD